MKGNRFRRTAFAAICGALLGIAAGLVLVLEVPLASAERAGVEGSSWIEATHLPPLLRAPSEPPELRYDVYCGSAAQPEADSDRACDVSGVVFVRAGEHGAFREVPLRVDPHASEGRFVADLPRDIAEARDGFSYYAVLRKDGADDVVLPAGGAAAPQRSLELGDSIVVDLGHHVFGRTRRADALVAQAAWGDAPGEVGLEQGRNSTPIGGASFDVDGTGSVVLLDEAHRRLLRWRPGARIPETTPVAINGTIADLALAADGTAYVLESAGGPLRSNTLRVFDAKGTEIASGATAERASEVRIGTNGDALVQEEPSEQWTVAARDGNVLPASAQRASGRADRRTRDGSDVVVLRRGSELRLASTTRSGVRRSWRVTSDDPLAEVQLAEPFGRNLVVVARVYSDSQDEFLVLVLGAKGLVRSFSVASEDWAETAPLSRFRLVGSSLYRLGSTPEHVFVDRFDLEVK